MDSHFDYLVIGAGSGGLATALKAAQCGAKVALIEESLLGGTCVNVGCVPKKIMWLASYMATSLKNAHDYGFEFSTPELDWTTLVSKREAYIQKLHHIYLQKIQQHGVTLIKGKAQFNANQQVAVNNKTLTAAHITIATGGVSRFPDIPGANYGICSNGFFDLPSLPKRVAIVGAGYIALELAGMLKSFGCDTTLVYRHDNILRSFDHMLSDKLLNHYQTLNIRLKPNHTPIALEKHLDDLTILCQGNKAISHFDTVIWAIGREADILSLKLNNTKVALAKNGAIEVDEFQNTSVNGIYAIGDVTTQVALTPVAIAAGRRLALRLFGDSKQPLKEENIPSVLFSHPPIGTVGLSEQQARDKYGDDITIYQSEFTPMSQVMCQQPIKTTMKLITVASTQKVIGCHMIGDNVDEILQGFAVAINVGATKQDLDNTIAIHPTSAEELVTMN